VDRWTEEEILVKNEMQWTILWFILESSVSKLRKKAGLILEGSLLKLGMTAELILVSRLLKLGKMAGLILESSISKLGNGGRAYIRR